MKFQLVYPMALYVFYMGYLSVRMFKSRVQAIKSNEISLKFFQTYSGGSPSERTIIFGRHYDNQFQVPMLFFITCIMHIVLDAVNPIVVPLAWVFVISRFFHSKIHLGTNNVRHRVIAFAIGWLCIISFWIHLLLFIVKNSV